MSTDTHDAFSWRLIGEVVLGLMVTFESWLLRSVWNSKPSREEVRKMFEEFEARDEQRDIQQLQAITDQIAREIAQRDQLHRENVKQQELMRSEARECFKDVGDRIDGIYELLVSRPVRGH